MNIQEATYVFLKTWGGKYEFLPYRESIGRLYSYYRDNIASIDTETIRKDEYIKFCRAKEPGKNN